MPQIQALQQSAEQLRPRCLEWSTMLAHYSLSFAIWVARCLESVPPLTSSLQNEHAGQHMHSRTQEETVIATVNQ